jgi:hypothetical protein
MNSEFLEELFAVKHVGDDDDDGDGEGEGSTSTNCDTSIIRKALASKDVGALSVVCPHIMQVSSTTNLFYASYGSVVAKPGTCEGSGLRAQG